MDASFECQGTVPVVGAIANSDEGPLGFFMTTQTPIMALMMTIAIPPATLPTINGMFAFDPELLSRLPLMLFEGEPLSPPTLAGRPTAAEVGWGPIAPFPTIKYLPILGIPLMLT